MQLDSHRRQLSTSITSAPLSPPAPSVASTSVTPATVNTLPITNNDTITMPCPRFARARSGCCKDMTSTFTAEDGTEMRSWRSIRRENLWNMRRSVKHIVLCMALIEAMRVGPSAIVYAGKDGYAPRGPEDYGIAYNVGYFVSWIYMCLFAVVWMTFFEWWVPSSAIAPSDDPTNPNKLEKFSNALQKINMTILPIAVAISLARHFFHTAITLIYVADQPTETPRKLPANTKKNWLARLFLLAGIGLSLWLGHGIFQVLARLDLAHVKCAEYMAIVMPIQVNLGVVLGSLAQRKYEKKLEKRALRMHARAAELEQATGDEKQLLLV